MIFVSLAFLLGFLALRLPDQSSAFRTRVLTAMAVCWLVFVLDFVIRVLLAPHRGKYVALHPLVLVSIFIPPLRAIMGLRALALVLGGGAQRQRTAAAAEIAAWLVLLAVSFGSLAVVYFEVQNPHSTIRTPGTGLWWSFETISTVGYGDYTPLTVGGRVVAVCMMLIGIGLISTVSATLASGLIRVGREGRQHKKPQARGPIGRGLGGWVRRSERSDLPVEPEADTTEVTITGSPSAGSAYSDDDSDDDNLASSSEVEAITRTLDEVLAVVQRLEIEVQQLRQGRAATASEG